jgi:hypothetical protein
MPLLPSMIREIKQRAIESSSSKARELQFDSSIISLSNPKWDEALKTLMIHVADSLGLERSKVGCRLDKVILEDTGDCRHTTVHEGEVNHIGSLEIQLPSIFKGGAQIVRHDGMESAFDMGADDSSCKHDTWFLARFAGCEHEIQTITEGCRLVVAYSLVWKGAGPAPRAPPMAAVRQLVQTLRTSAGCAGLYLYGASPDALGRHGFGSLTHKWDRQHIGLLQAASAHMAQGNQPDRLVLHVCTATCLHTNEEVSPAQLDLRMRVYCPDGSEPDPAARTALWAFRYPEDMFSCDSEEVEDDDTLRSEQGINLGMDWWRDPAADFDRGRWSQVAAHDLGDL